MCRARRQSSLESEVPAGFARRTDGETDDQLLGLALGDAAEHDLLATEGRVPLGREADDLDQSDAGSETHPEPKLARDGPLDVQHFVAKQGRDGVGLLDEAKVPVGLLGQAREQDLVVLETIAERGDLGSARGKLLGEVGDRARVIGHAVTEQDHALEHLRIGPGVGPDPGSGGDEAGLGIGGRYADRGGAELLEREPEAAGEIGGAPRLHLLDLGSCGGPALLADDRRRNQDLGARVKDHEREAVAVGQTVDHLDGGSLGAVDRVALHRGRGVDDQDDAGWGAREVELLRGFDANPSGQLAALLGRDQGVGQRPVEVEIDGRDVGSLLLLGLALVELLFALMVEGPERVAVRAIAGTAEHAQGREEQQGSWGSKKPCHVLAGRRTGGFAKLLQNRRNWSEALGEPFEAVISTASVLPRRSALLSPALVLAGACLIALPARAAPPEPEQAGVEQPPEQLIPPKAKAPVTYEYPAELLEREQPPAGTVTLQYVVGVDGEPTEIEVLEGVDPVIDAAAVAAVGSLHFEPATYAGEPVEVVLSIELSFTPPEPEPEPTGDGDDTTEVGDSGDGGDTGDGGETPAGPIRITGKLVEAGRGTPVGGGTILAVPAGDYELGKVRNKRYGDEDEAEPEWMIKALSGDGGSFELRGVPDGRVRLIMLAPNFDRLEWVVELEPNKQLETKYFLSRNADNPFRTEVAVDRETMPEAVIRTINIEQVNEIPGTYGDALKAVQNFPGVARAPFGAGQLTIRGAAPADSGVYLGYHEIPTLFHFGGLTSVFNSDILAQIDFIPGNFDSRYGDATGGIINVQPRKGRRDGYHGYVDTDLFDTGVLVEGRLGKGSFILSGRRSYVDLILPLVIPDEVGFGLTLAPRYWDYQALFDYPVGGGELSVRVFGSDDRTKLLFTEENDVSDAEADSLETIQWFHRVDLVYRKVAGPWEFLITPSYKREYLSSSLLGNIKFNIESDNVSARAEISRRLSKNARLRMGAEFVGTWYRGRAELPGFGGGSPSPGLASASTRETSDIRPIPALYSTLTLRVAERLLLFPGLRLNFYAGDLNYATVDPRLRFILSVTDKTRLKGGVGQYSQAPGLLQTDEVFGNATLLPERSLHTSLAIDQDLPWDLNLEVTGFYKRLWKLSSSSTALSWVPGDDSPGPENFASVGTGHIYGGEVLLKKQLGDHFYGWLSYTLMRSVRTPAPGETQRLFDFDQTHILTLIASYDFKFNWRIGARFRVVSGNPYTPVTSAVFNADSATFLPIQGPPNSARLPTFHQLDLRVDKTWVYRRIRVTSYLDIQNVYNAQNVEFLNYSYDYRQTRPIDSLPTAPSIGLKLEW